MCSMHINGRPHGPKDAITTCQLHMRSFKDGDTIVVEPWRATAFPVVKDLVVDRSAFDRIIAAGGFVSVNTGTAQDGNSIPIPKTDADIAFAAAACIGCGACVAACKNASAMLFVSAKVNQLAHLPQGQVERKERVRKWLLKWMKKDLVIVQTQVLAKQNVRKEFHLAKSILFFLFLANNFAIFLLVE
jgi:succinate dehydrogenase / fumarate reductase iron-sulfur subunit